MPVLKKCELEVYFQKELCQVDGFDGIVFGDLSREDIINFYKLKKKVKGVIRRYQTLIMREDKFKEVIAMQEFDKYRGLETQQIH